ncbi:hypothetical protein AAFM46_16635 (plasmid) [Arthrobacter sp. TMP15]|uniref:hypothetical protein n=1 Tax=Arthrobacter sp. TMP15 TaxID=3140789 RepID=UPI0031BA925C
MILLAAIIQMLNAIEPAAQAFEGIICQHGQLVGKYRVTDIALVCRFYRAFLEDQFPWVLAKGPKNREAGLQEVPYGNGQVLCGQKSSHRLNSGY